METIRHLYLDLEGTIITPVMNGWYDTHLINLEKIKYVMEWFVPSQVHIFSFAIWNQSELNRFNDGTRPMIEKALGIEFQHVPIVDDDIVPVCTNVRGMGQGSVDFMECSNFWGKHEAFRLYMRHRHKTAWEKWQIESSVVLLDDAVWNENFEWPDKYIKGQIINIDENYNDI